MRKEIAARLPESKVRAEKVDRYRVSSNAASTIARTNIHGFCIGEVACGNENAVFTMKLMKDMKG